MTGRAQGLVDSVQGVYQEGAGNASSNLSHVRSMIAKRIGFDHLEAGTFNVAIEEHYPLTAVDGVIGPDEYAHHDECIKLRRCRVKRAEAEGAGAKAVIVRPSQHEDPVRRPRHWLRLEIMAPVNLRRTLDVSPGDAVIVEAEKEGDDGWWSQDQ